VLWREAGFARCGIQKDLRLVAGSQKIAGTTEATKSFIVHQRQRWTAFRHEDIVLRIWQQKATGKPRKNFDLSMLYLSRCDAFHLICIRGYT
jgi:hypothetical protein